VKKLRIGVTEAARNFADCVNRARCQNVTFVLLQNGSPVARLVPEKEEKVCAGRDLAGAELLEGEAKAWRRDLSAARKALKAPVNKWQ
jgi:antitoxin (DNA-binding transcriptional repressor) of toxin-antitoxin stability system